MEENMRTIQSSLCPQPCQLVSINSHESCCLQYLVSSIDKDYGQYICVYPYFHSLSLSPLVILCVDLLCGIICPWNSPYFSSDSLQLAQNMENSAHRDTDKQKTYNCAEVIKDDSPQACKMIYHISHGLRLCALGLQQFSQMLLFLESEVLFQISICKK